MPRHLSATAFGRTCSRCNTFKPHSEFTKDTREKYQTRNPCKVCAAATLQRERLNARAKWKVSGRPDTKKRCRTCGETKNTAEFHVEALGLLGRSSNCKTCASHSHRRLTFGITAAVYHALYAKQHGLCAMCKRPERARRNGKLLTLAVDHDHITGALRGLLCTNCNRALAYIENAEFYAIAKRYLAEHAS